MLRSEPMNSAEVQGVQKVHENRECIHAPV